MNNIKYVTLSLLTFLYTLITVQAEAADKVNNKEELRSSKYSHISKYLETLHDSEISTILKNGIPVHSGTGGTSAKLEIDGVPIFVKLIPLNELEGKLENYRSTENLFNLPHYYQYGVNSAGFSAWRELSAHAISTDWVLAGKNKNFPLMYHWRIVPNTLEKDPLDEEELKNYVKYWNDSSPIGERFRANYNAPSHIALFIEYIPETLNSWLTKQLVKGDNAIDKAIEMVERNLSETIAFINANGMLHFDAHFHNILTDGEHLYFSDFGLATSSQFALSKEEMQFFQNHQNFDRCYACGKLTQWIISRTFGKDRLDEVLQDYAKGKTPPLLPKTVTPFLESIVKRYAPITLIMKNFFDDLTHKSKTTSYPAKELDKLWIETITDVGQGVVID